jgi:hypothetical protein
MVAEAASDAPGIALAALLPLPFLIVAYLFARQSIEARRPKAA